MLQQNIYTQRRDEPIFTRQGVQIVRVEEDGKGLTYLDTSNNVLPIDPVVGSEDTDFANIKLASQSGTALFDKQVSKFAIRKVRYELFIRNINPRNNVLQFYVDSGISPGVIVDGKFTSASPLYTVTLDEGVYTSEGDIAKEIEDKMNTLTGITGVSFARASIPLNTGFYRFTATGGTFAWAWNSSTEKTNLMLLRGKHLANLSKSQEALTTHDIGDIQTFYTRYIDIVSKDLTETNRINSQVSNDKGRFGLLYRLYISLEGGLLVSGIDSFDRIDNLRWIGKENSKSIQSLDIQLLDEFGLPLYLPKLDKYTRSNSYIAIDFITD